MLTISVLIPTWRRPEMLARCLAAVARQSVLPLQVVIATRRDDELTCADIDQLSAPLLAAGVAVDIVRIEPGPLTAAMNGGLARTIGDLVALTDDDAEPFPNWLELLKIPFADETVGGVGGRDWQPHERGSVQTVGQVSWFGRTSGNHHLGRGPARSVDLLKGVNCCFRGDELRRLNFDRRLRGLGNVSHWEMSLCFTFRRAGWRLIYDPAIGVKHNIAPRHDNDTNARGLFEPTSFQDSVHNETLAVLEHLPSARRIAFLIWATIIGTGESPGLAQICRLLARRSPNPILRWRATLGGRITGTKAWFASQAVGATVLTKP